MKRMSYKTPFSLEMKEVMDPVEGRYLNVRRARKIFHVFSSIAVMSLVALRHSGC
jgi:hypothetical protein